jgi:hypothetical protein
MLDVRCILGYLIGSLFWIDDAEMTLDLLIHLIISIQAVCGGDVWRMRD